MWPEVFRRMLRQRGRQPTLMGVVAHAILTGDEAEVQRRRSELHAHRREQAERDEERERYEEAARELRERVMRNGSYFPGDD